MTTTNLALLPDYMDPVTLIGYFGTWALVGLLVVVFIESGVLFPVLPGDSLLFVAGMIAAGTQTVNNVDPGDFALWKLLVFIPIAAVLGGQVGYWIGRRVGTTMFKPNARFLKQKYADEAHLFFEERGPVAIVLGRFVPIVRTIVPIVAGTAKMHYGAFVAFNALGAIVWGIGLTVLGYWLGTFAFVSNNIEPIIIGIVVLSVLPIAWEWFKRRKAARAAGAGPGEPLPE